jgi:N6-adenosine-specific RNA methylase IME4
MKFHPYAEVFPLMSDAQLEELAEDILTYGLYESIVLHPDGSILDGRNRWLACEKVGVEPKLRTWRGSDPLAYVISENVKRRHLNESQRAMVAARVATMGHGGDRRSDQAANLPVETQESAARALGVAERSVRSARKVQIEGSKDLVAAVDAGEVAVSLAAKVAELPKADQKKALSGKDKGKTAKRYIAERNRHEKVEALAEKSEPLDKLPRRFSVLYADPPWRYDDNSTDPTRVIENQYPTMPLEEICALPVAKVATDDAILFLWATSPLLAKAIDVVRAWGFEYKTCAVWDKGKIGMGYFFRQRHELLLVAVRGDMPKPPVEARVPSVIEHPRGKHSQKPDRFYEIIEAFYPELSKIELFARQARKGWFAWGNEATP